MIEALKSFSTVYDGMDNYRGGLLKLDGYFFQMRSLMALPIIYLGTRLNTSFRLNKYVAYYFYPVHLAVLVILRLIIQK